MKLNILKYALVLAILLPLSGYSQCRSYAKRKCRPSLEPYIHSGQLQSTILRPGETAELTLTFTAGQSYRVLVCAQPILGDVTFQVMDTDKNLIYDSAEAEEGNRQAFDFKVVSTQQLVIKINVPEDPDAVLDLVPEGCIAILTGFKS